MLKYTYFKLHDPAVHIFNSTLEYRCDPVKGQIAFSKDDIKLILNLVLMFLNVFWYRCNL